MNTEERGASHEQRAVIGEAAERPEAQVGPSGPAGPLTAAARAVPRLSALLAGFLAAYGEIPITPLTGGNGHIR